MRRECMRREGMLIKRCCVHVRGVSVMINVLVKCCGVQVRGVSAITRVRFDCYNNVCCTISAKKRIKYARKMGGCRLYQQMRL